MPKLNKQDEYTKLNIPSSIIKRFMNDIIDKQSYQISTIDTKDKEHPITKKQNISICSSYLIITASVESLISYIITEASLFINSKSNDGLYELTYDDIETAIYKNDELRENFLKIIQCYNKNLNFNVIENKILNDFIDKIDKNIKLNKNVINFLQYLINYYCCEFLRISYSIMIEFNKLRITSSIIKSCWNIMFIGKYNARLMKEFEEKIMLIDKFKEERKNKSIEDNKQSINDKQFEEINDDIKNDNITNDDIKNDDITNDNE